MNASTGSSPRPVPRAPKLLGRETQEATVCGLVLEEDSRLVTLTGTGGIGKTSLALRVAERLRGRFADGIGYVALAAIVDPALVVPTIAQALAIPERAGSSPEADVEGVLCERDFLLILDNFEQVLPAATAVANLLEACPRLRILVTSRTWLKLRFEQVYSVPPLDPPADSHLGSTAVTANSAVALFVARARAVDSAFALTDANAPAVAEICRRLEGLPLAIELAAARIKVLPPAAMLTRLHRRLPLLTGGPQNAPVRQQTLRATIAWSYDLLDEEARTLFRRLCVFAGGGSLHAIQAFCLADAEARGDATPESENHDPSNGQPSPLTGLDELAALVDGSLLWQEEQDDGEPRFLMLETVREFGVDQLTACGEDRAIKGRHAAYFLTLAEAAAPRLRGAERTAWLDRLEREHDNLRSALAWFIAEGDAAGALRLAAALWQFWWWRSHLSEGRLRLGEVLALPVAERATPARARALTGAGVLTETQGDVAEADALHAESMAIWKQLGDERGLANSLLFRWLIALNHDDHNAMDGFAAESLRIFRESGEVWGTAMSLMELGIGAMRRYDAEEAIRHLTEGRDLFRAIKDAWGEAISTGVIGNVALTKGEVAQGVPLLRECLEALLKLNDQWGVATFLPAAARVEAELGRWERCVILSGAVDALGQSIGAPLKDPFRRRFELNLSEARKTLPSEVYKAAWALGQAMTAGEAIAFAFDVRGVDEAPGPSASPQRTVSPEAAGLTPREMEVLCLANRSAKDIADALFVSTNTIWTHLENIRRKLGLESKSELSAYAARHGYL